MNNRRIGKFFISGNVMYDQLLASKLFQLLNFIPLRVEHLAYADKFELIGISDWFSASASYSPETVVREYDLSIQFDSDNEIIGITVK